MKRLRSVPRLRARPTDANKATVGRVLVVGGSSSLVGAPAMAGLGALRGGAGLVQVAVPGSIQATVAGFRPEVTTLGLPETRAGGLGASAGPVLRTLVAGWDSVVLGPGAGRAPATVRLLRTFTLAADRPLVLDADGLFAWNRDVKALRARSLATLLTPHEGEAGRLLGVTSDEIRADREAAAARIAEESGAVVVLKGPGTLVTDGQRMYRNRTGGPVLATGGTGDVLAGLAGALLAGRGADGLDPFEAACVAVHAHGEAATTVAQGRDRGLLATELADGIPEALHGLRKGRRA